MPEKHDLDRLEPSAFEHMVNSLVLRVLGTGATGFGPGSDGGRDGFFEGSAPYPSSTEHWKGVWYIQCKFHKPHLSKDPQKWLLNEIQKEIKGFEERDSKRKWPDNWIIATNIDPSGTPMTGAFDKARRLFSKARPKMKGHFHIWGGRKILDLLSTCPDVAGLYAHFLTPGNVLAEMYSQLKDSKAEISEVLRYLIVNQFQEQRFTKLDQAGSDADSRPGIHHLFFDVPCRDEEHRFEGPIMVSLVQAAGKCHRIDAKLPDTKEWRIWRRHPYRARVWFVKAGPGHGKSTIGQYFSQIQRAALILERNGPLVIERIRTEAEEVRKYATESGIWTENPRIPILVELKDYAQWLGQQRKDAPAGILTYLATRLSAGIEQKVEVGLLKRALKIRSWFIAFDGLDEVPHDVKDAVALEVRNFLENVTIECNCDLLSICTSRPQGYSGQFSEIDGPTIELTNLTPDQAIACARPVIELGRAIGEASKSLENLKAAVASGAVSELMTTPLQAHIMAVVVRDGGRPPDRRWQLFANFYQVIKRREANKNLPDIDIARLLREDEKLLKTLHNRLGFLLHARAETSKGAVTHIGRAEFKKLAQAAVAQMVETGPDRVVEALMRATKDRLVLVSTPDDGDHLRFDIRPLQEFFAAEFLYESVGASELGCRMDIIAGDAHWREVTHFLLSALVENDRQTELSVAIDSLENLNEDDSDPGMRLLKRRMGRGAMVAARLLREGVLEQDKRHRQLFRKSIEPMCTFTSFQELDPLLRVRQPNSSRWLINFLYAWITETDYKESVGAMLTLARMLPDSDPIVQKVSEFVLSAPPEYTAAVLRGLHPPSHGAKYSRSAPQLWFLKAVVRVLSKNDWCKLGVCGVEAAINLLGSQGTVRPLGLSDGQSELVNMLVSDPEFDTKNVDYGSLAGCYFKHDWTTGTLPTALWTAHISEEKVNVSGAFGFLYKLFRWSKTRSFDDFQCLMRSIDSDIVEVLPSLPKHVRAYLPIDEKFPLDCQLAQLRRLTLEQHNALIINHSFDGTRVLRPISQLSIATGKMTSDTWTKFVNEAPSFALYVWSQNSDLIFGLNGRAPFSREMEGLMLDRVMCWPEVLLQFPGLWGRLLDVSGSRFEDLRRRIRDAAARRLPSTRRLPRSGFSSFQLQLPADAPCLPHFINTGFELARSYDWELGASPNDPATLASRVKFCETEMRNLIGDESQSSDVRAAAIIMMWLQPNNGGDVQTYCELLVKLCERGLGGWFFRCVAACLARLLDRHISTAETFMAKLLHATRTNLASRSELNFLFSTWREASHAPVQKAQIADAWLKGS